MVALNMFNFHITLDDIQQFMSIAITLHCQIPYQTHMAALTMFNFHITLDDIQQFMSIAITLHCQIPYQTSFYQYSTHSKRVQQKHLF